MPAHEALEPRAMVQCMDQAVRKYVSGLAEQAPTLSLIRACCRQLRAAALDAEALSLVDFIEHCARLSLESLEHPEAQRRTFDPASVRIELMKSVWQLDARLAAVPEELAAGPPRPP